MFNGLFGLFSNDIGIDLGTANTLICVVGELAFIPTIFLLVGRWRRSSAIRDQQDHDRLVNEEFEELSTSDQFIEGVPA